MPRGQFPNHLPAHDDDDDVMRKWTDLDGMSEWSDGALASCLKDESRRMQ